MNMLQLRGIAAACHLHTYATAAHADQSILDLELAWRRLSLCTGFMAMWSVNTLHVLPWGMAVLPAVLVLQCMPSAYLGTLGAQPAARAPLAYAFPLLQMFCVLIMRSQHVNHGSHCVVRRGWPQAPQSFKVLRTIACADFAEHHEHCILWVVHAQAVRFPAPLRALVAIRRPSLSRTVTPCFHKYDLEKVLGHKIGQTCLAGS